MKKALIIIAALVVVYAVAVYAEGTQQKNTGAGLQVATTTTQKVGFYGATPTNQLTVTVSTNGIDNTAATLKRVIDALRVVGLVATN